MAQPVFCPTQEFLRKRLKLGPVTDGTDTDAVVDQATLDVRLELYRHLGTTRVAEIAAGNWSETPDTEAELLRALGATTEINWCRAKLLRTLNPLWMEGSGGSKTGWNETPLARQQGSLEIKSELKRLDKDISAALSILKGDVAFGNDVLGGEAFLVTSTVTPPKPGQSIWPSTSFIQG